LNAFFLNALQQYGSPALWLIIFVAAAGAPIPVSPLLFAAGAFSALGDFNILILFPVVVSASVMGDNLGYLIGRRVGKVLVAWLERQTRFHWIMLPALAQSRAYFRRRGGWAIFMTRFLFSALGGSTNLLAGLEEYPYPNFLFWDVSGEILGALISLGLGYVFAETWEEVAGLFGAFSGLLLALLTAIVFSTLIMQKIRQRRHASAVKNEANDTSQVLASKTEHDTDDPLLIPQMKRP
jgi:membrane-associated protein